MKIVLTLSLAALLGVAAWLVWPSAPQAISIALSEPSQVQNVQVEEDLLPGGVIQRDSVEEEITSFSREQFLQDLIERVDSPDGRAYQDQQEEEDVQSYLERGERLPVDSLPDLLGPHNTWVPISDLDSFQVLNMREMSFVRNTAVEQHGVLSSEGWFGRDGRKLIDLNKVNKQRIKDRIDLGPASVPPEVIFSAYSTEDYFPIEDRDFLFALAQSRNRGLLDVAAAWMEYQVWVSSAYSLLHSRPEYQAQSLSIYEIDALDPVAAALADYHQAEKRYLFMILDDMAAFGYLDLP